MRATLSFILTVLLAAFAAVPALAQADSGWYYGKPIKVVSFEGLDTIKASDLEGITSAFRNRPFSDDLYEDLLNRTYALNYFEDISDIKVNPLDGDYVTCKSIQIILVVKEFPVIRRIRYTGYRQLRLAELKDAVSSKEKEIYSENKRLIDERALRDLYIGKGYTEAKVSSTAEEGENGVEVTFVIDEGQRTVVKEILFSGNRSVTNTTLRNRISLKRVGVFNKGAFQDAQVDQDSKTIVAYYQDRGYVDARVVSTDITPSFNEEKNRRELTIQFNIQEGSRYTFSGVSFSGNKVFDSDTLQRLIRLSPGETYSETKYQESLQNVRNKYYENGYTSNMFDSRMDKNPNEKTVGYTIIIVENVRSHIDNVIIKGNGRTKEEVIRREIPIESGDVFSNAKIMNGMRNLMNLQYFSSVYPEVTPGAEENLVDLVFTVEEQSTQTLDLGFTFSGVSDPDEFPISLYVKLQDSNLWGEGKTASIGTELSTSTQSLTLSYGQNWLFEKPISNTIAFSVARSREYDLRNYVVPDGSVNYSNYYMQYQSYSFGVTETVGRRWTPDFAILSWTGGISGNLINNVYNEDLYMPYDSSVSDYSSWEPKNYIFTAFSMDGRNIAWDPSTGWFWSQRFAWYGLLPRGVVSENFGEKEFYLRTDTKGELYFTLLDLPVSEKWNFKMVLMLYSGISMMFPLPDISIKQSNQLYIDGMFYGRGWSIYNTAAGRGKGVWNNSVELRFPLVPGILAFDLFFDASMIKDEVPELFTGFGSLNDWYFSYGPSLRFCIQQFPLRLLFVSNFKFTDGEFSWKTARNKDTSWLSSWHFVLSFNITNR